VLPITPRDNKFFNFSRRNILKAVYKCNLSNKPLVEIIIYIDIILEINVTVDLILAAN
jgi:hypothetical protein